MNCRKPMTKSIKDRIIKVYEMPINSWEFLFAETFAFLLLLLLLYISCNVLRKGVFSLNMLMKKTIYFKNNLFFLNLKINWNKYIYIS